MTIWELIVLLIIAVYGFIGWRKWHSLYRSKYPVSDYASCNNCNWYKSYYADNLLPEKWESTTIKEAKTHANVTGHSISYYQKLECIINGEEK